MFFTRRAPSPVVRSYSSRGRLGEFIRMSDGKVYVRTAYGFIKIAPEAATVISVRFWVLRAIALFMGIVALAGWTVVVVK